MSVVRIKSARVLATEENAMPQCNNNNDSLFTFPITNGIAHLKNEKEEKSIKLK